MNKKHLKPIKPKKKFKGNKPGTKLEGGKSIPKKGNFLKTTVQTKSFNPVFGVFSELIEPIQQALSDTGYKNPTPIQTKSIPPLLKKQDILGSAQTGTGKTAAFVLPILQDLAINKKKVLKNRPRVLILAPTRELAAQIGNSISIYGKYLPITRTVIFGGVKQHIQVNSLNRGKDIVVATPGRLLDLMNQGYIILDNVETFVLDEADRMLDMGFIPDIRKIITKLPTKRHSLFFSATMSHTVLKLADTLVRNPVRIEITPEQPAVDKIIQKVYFVGKKNKDKLLISLLNDTKLNKVLIFTKMKHSANKVAKKLTNHGINADAIHGNKSQNARTIALDKFKNNRIRVLVATDIAARGIDVNKITHVINYDLPHEPETYIHRIGRTARAGTDGSAISFCSSEERDFLRDIESLIRKKIPEDHEHEYHDESARLATGKAARPAPRPQRIGKRRFGGNRNKKRY